MNLFLENGYANMKRIIARKEPFIIVFGARATGKTYGALKTLIESGDKFILLRRTQTQIDIISKPDFSPFKSVCNDLGLSYETKSLSKYQSGVYFDEEQAPRCYLSALATFSNIRGFDASDITTIVFDEFIKERHEKTMRGEADALFNIIETVGRNRELQGKAPLKVVLLANSNDVANPIFIKLGIVNSIMKMVEAGREEYSDTKRGLLVFNLANSPISVKKSETSLYKLTAGTSYAKMALENQFSENLFRETKSRNLRGYRLLASIGEISIYKSRADFSYYISSHADGEPKRKYTLSDVDLLRFQREQDSVWDAYIDNRVLFESPAMEVLLSNYFNA